MIKTQFLSILFYGEYERICFSDIRLAHTDGGGNSNIRQLSEMGVQISEFQSERNQEPNHVLTEVLSWHFVLHPGSSSQK